MLSSVTPRALLSCASRGATPGKLVQRRSMRGSGGIPGVSSGGSQTSNHTASNPPAIFFISERVRIKKGYQRYIKKEERGHLPPGTPPPMTPAIDTLASRSSVCCSGSISTPESWPISRILLRICYNTREHEIFSIPYDQEKLGVEITSVSRWAS